MLAHVLATVIFAVYVIPVPNLDVGDGRVDFVWRCVAVQALNEPSRPRKWFSSTLEIARGDGIGTE